MPEDNNKKSYSVKEAAEAYSVGDATIRDEIRAGRIAAKRLGRRIVIPQQALDEWIENLPFAIEDLRDE